MSGAVFKPCVDPKFCLCVTTYRKNKALDRFLESLLEVYDRDKVAHVVVCDDEYPTAQPVIEKYLEQFEGRLVYIGGTRSGIAKNKNRGLAYFLKETKDQLVVLFDDDIQFRNPGLENALLQAGWGHINGYLGVPGQDPLTLPHFISFPVTPDGASDETKWFSNGAQGVMLFMTREVVEAVGYWDTDWKGKYGYDHAVYSARINRFYGYKPQYYATLKNCERYFITQEVANDYEAKPEENHPQYLKKMENITNGDGLRYPDPGVTYLTFKPKS